MIPVFYTAGDGHGWAIDEDLRQIRDSLKGVVCETSLARARVVHSPFWMALEMHPEQVLARRFIIAHADNPPYFYLKQPEFVRVQRQVDLWIARSHEAEQQFRSLGLPVEYIPYTIDPGLFFPTISCRGEKAALRRSLGLPEDVYLIANFHRDSEGSALNTPKLQKAPELLLMILRRLKARGEAFHVLLAGPRRHWLRTRLNEEAIPYSFVGKDGIIGDDFGVNILTRPQLNELYNAADLYLVPSRWEGGPQSLMEAAAARCKILSTPLGLARDILEPDSLFHTASEATDIIQQDIMDNHLGATVQPQFARWEKNHTTPVMADRLRQLYQRLPMLSKFSAKNTWTRRALRSQLSQWTHSLRRRLGGKPKPAAVCIRHTPGQDDILDLVMGNVRASIERSGLRVSDKANLPVLRGWSEATQEGGREIWFYSPTARQRISPRATVVVPSVQDAINLRANGCVSPVVVIPFFFEVGDVSGESLIIDQGDLHASIKVWQALLAGRPVIYPARSAYYEQVYHAGLPYESPAELSEAASLVRKNWKEMSELARPPVSDVSDRALLKLLTQLS